MAASRLNTAASDSTRLLLFHGILSAIRLRLLEEQEPLSCVGLAGEQEGKVPAAMVASARVWASTGRPSYSATASSWSTELLDCPPLSGGAWAWELRAARLSRGSFFVGLASGRVSATRFLGDQRAGFAYGDAGIAMHGSDVSMSCPKFAEGDVLRLVLDVDKCSFSVSVNGAQPFFPFPALDPRERHAAADPAQFTPAVCFGAPGGSVTLVSFDKLPPASPQP